jgi:hypothetical protein
MRGSWRKEVVEVDTGRETYASRCSECRKSALVEMHVGQRREATDIDTGREMHADRL